MAKKKPDLPGVQSDYEPLRDAAGKRDRAERYVNTKTGEVVARRQYDETFKLPKQGLGKTLERRSKTREKAHLKKQGGRKKKGGGAIIQGPTPERTPEEIQQDADYAALGNVHASQGFFEKSFTRFDDAAAFMTGTLKRVYGSEKPGYEAWMIAQGLISESNSGDINAPEDIEAYQELDPKDQIAFLQSHGVWRSLMGLTAVSDLKESDMTHASAEMDRLFSDVGTFIVRWRSRAQEKR